MTSNRYDRTTTNDVIFKTDKIFDNIELGHTIFDILDDDDDDDNDDVEKDDDIKKQHARLEEAFSMDFNFGNTYNSMEEEEVDKNDSINDNDDDDADEDHDNEDDNDRNQVSMTNNNEIDPFMNEKRRHLPITTTTTKRMRTDMVVNNKIDPIPDYLLTKNKLFDRMICTIMDSATSSIDLEELRQIAFFIHYIHYYTILYDLWSVYLKAGTGTLRGEKEEEEKEEETNQSINYHHHHHRRYWSKLVKSLKSDQKETLPSVLTEEDEQLNYELVVYRRLRENNEKIQHYQKQLNEKKTYLIGFTQTIEDKIELFVQRYGILYHQLKCNFAIAMVHYDYDDQLLQYEYQQENPTEYQIDIAKRLYDVNVQLENVKCDFIEFRQRILCNRPSTSLDTLQIPLPSYIDTLLNDTIRQELIYQHDTLIQHTITELMVVYLAALEAKIEQYQTIVNRETDEMRQNKQMTPSLIRLITKRIWLMSEKLKVQCHFLINYYIRSPYGHLENVKKGKEKNIKRLGFLPSIIIDSTIATTHHLTHQQLQLLNRGPTYVPPCQLRLLSSSSSSSSQSMNNTILEKQYASLQHQMAFQFSKFNVDKSRQDRIIVEIKKEFKDLYSTPLASNMHERVFQEKKLIQSIRRTLQKNDLILRRTADHNNVFYLGNRNDFEKQSNDYMKESDSYTLLFNIDENSEQHIRDEIEKIVQCMNLELENLYKHNRLSQEVYEMLQIKIENLELPYLYFLPDVSTEKNHILVKPMIVSHRSVTTNIATFLNRLLRPVMNRHMYQTTTLVNEADFIQKLHHYTYTKHYLQSTTLFATIKITNFHTIASHESMVNILVRFLTDHLATNKLEYISITEKEPQQISITTIRELTELFLDNNIFYYNGNIYGFTRGGPTSLLLSETLSNIYLFMWEKKICAHPKIKKEFYGRYNDQIFFTWNGKEDELRTFLNTITEKYPTISMDISISKCVNFLNAYIKNCNGLLYTRVYHPPNSQRYNLPYVVGHAKLIHSHWFRSALMRAVRYCSNCNDFKQERISLEIACLLNGYSLDFIETQLKHFYQYFNAETIRFCMNQTMYDKFRRRLFDFIDRQRKKLDTYQVLENVERIIRLHYLYDYGPREKFNKKFHAIWTQYLTNHPQLSSEKTKIILTTKHVYSLNALLAQQKPNLF